MPPHPLRSRSGRAGTVRNARSATRPAAHQLAAGRHARHARADRLHAPLPGHRTGRGLLGSSGGRGRGGLRCRDAHWPAHRLAPHVAPAWQLPAAAGGVARLPGQPRNARNACRSVQPCLPAAQVPQHGKAGTLADPAHRRRAGGRVAGLDGVQHLRRADGCRPGRPGHRVPAGLHGAAGHRTGRTGVPAGRARRAPGHIPAVVAMQQETGAEAARLHRLHGRRICRAVAA
ncbi:hypothetical protein D3C72_1432750 [compost metagenome]